ncbi:MAG: DUF456 domain-containing protein [Candidatus Eisenbacteria sp.]|nr:DUF456 domain-containing protein [Candidatus Eisenbacteria bacterium]
MPWTQIGNVALVVLLDVLLLAGLIAIPVGLSGTFILVGFALIIALLTGFQAVTLWALLLLLAFAIVGEIIESSLGSLMARRYGASKWGMIGAYVGGIVGAIAGTPILPIIGTLIGSFIGAAGLAVLFEWIHLRQLGASMPPGWGAILGKALASFLKLGIGLATAVFLHVRVVGYLFP